MASRDQGLVIALGFAAAVASGCGGGGGGDGGIHVTWDPNPLTASYAQGQYAVSVPVAVTLSSLPTEDVYVGVTDDGGGLADTQINAESMGENRFQGYLHPKCTLAPGTHSGNLTLHLCADSSCAHEYGLSGNVLPYTFTVADPTLAVTVKIDGVVQSVGFACRTDPDLEIVSGHTLTFESNADVEWTYSALDSGHFPVATNVQTTPRSWSATISAGGPTAPGVMSGFVLMDAATTSGTPASVSLSVDVVGAP